jgi:hypothetical protein
MQPIQIFSPLVTSEVGDELESGVTERPAWMVK